jgi:hypothetical protein
MSGNMRIRSRLNGYEADDLSYSLTELVEEETRNSEPNDKSRIIGAVPLAAERTQITQENGEQ